MSWADDAVNDAIDRDGPRSKRKARKPKAITCPYCSQPAVFVSSSEVYRHDYGMIYLCRPCRAWVGVHNGTATPKGSLANAELRAARIKAHAAFDELWKSQQYTRSSAYKWLAEQLEITSEQCHIGMFDIETCNRVVQLLKESNP